MLNRANSTYTTGKNIKIFAVLVAMSLVLTGVTLSQSRGTGVDDVYDNATYLSQSTPGEMNPGQTYGVSVTMKNSGRSTWQQGNYSLKLINVNASAINTWSISTIDVNSSVSPGHEIVFNFNLVAPVEGSYNIQWQMANGNAYFGEPSMTVPVRVAGTAPPVITPQNTSNSKFISQQVPGSMDAGQTYDVIIIMKNAGEDSWKPGENRLKISTKGGDNTENWSVANVELSGPVVSGSNVTFTFKVTAPQKSGAYNFQSQVVRNETFFGEPSTNVIVNVN